MANQKLTAKIAKKSREERKENRCYSKILQQVNSKTPFFATFAAVLRDLRG
jgi:hypothetical protein